MAATDGAPLKPHALVFPIPAQGHITPMLSFSTQLALRGFIITFLSTETSRRLMLKAQNARSLSRPDPADPDLPSLDIRFVTIPDGPDPDAGMLFTQRSRQTFGQRLRGFLENFEQQRGLIEKIVQSSKGDSHPISCIVADSMFPWTQDIADKQGIGRIIFWANAGTGLGLLLRYKKTGKWTLHDDETHYDESSDEKGRLRVLDSEFLPGIPFRDADRMRTFTRKLDGAENAVCIAVNSFEELDSFNMKVSSEYSIPIRYVGPLMPVEGRDLAPSKSLLRGDLFEEEGDCLEWLSRQKPASVLYVAFGSVAVLTTAQIEELALGIEDSERPFLWVARANIEGGTVFPEGFIERTRERGLVIGWAPQLRVLEHEATGAFVTHCGWNSTLEGLYMGVPMLCLPITADQPMNELLIAKQWRAGVAMAKGEDGIVRKEEVARAVKAVMEGREVRDEAKRWKEEARKAVAEGGSSSRALNCLIQDIHNLSVANAHS